MRKLVYSICAVSAIFASCTKEHTTESQEPEKVTITLKSYDTLENEGTRTWLTAENKIFWNQTGEYLEVFLTGGGQNGGCQIR